MEKLKSENYQLTGGINTKFSPYTLGPMEFLDLQNFDFQTLGSLTQRWGSTMYVGQTLPGKISSLFEFTRLDGTSMVFFGSSGSIYYGATTGQSQGLSLIGFTAMDNRNPAQVFAGYVTDTYAAPNATMLSQSVPYLGAVNQRLYLYQTYNITGQTMSDNVLDAAVLNNYLFVADGTKFFKFNGVTASFVGLPPPISFARGSTVYGNAGFVDIGIGSDVSGSYGFYASWVNQRGFESQIWPIRAVNATQANSVSLGGTFLQLANFFVLPPQYDIASVNIYSYWSGSTLEVGSTAFWNNPYVYLANYTPSNALFLGPGSSVGFAGQLANATIMGVALGTTIVGMGSLRANFGAFPDQKVNTYYPLGLTLIPSGSSATPGAALSDFNEVRITSYIPRYVKAFQNRLFLAGFSSTPSTVWFSDVGEPEGYPLDNNFEVRTNDGDMITAMFPYQGRLYIFKRNSFHVLSGDSPANFLLQEVSGQRGALNNRCVTTYGENEMMLFLDRKGLVMWNGANGQMLSLKMQNYFDRMNYTAALTEACLVHDKLRNQVLCAIPIDGSTTNNITLVYDYAAEAWTTYKGLAPSVFAVIQGRNNTRNVFFGSYSGMISWYGPSFTSDSSVGFTCYLKTRFIHDLGDSVQKEFRRLFLNCDVPGTTLNYQVNFYQDYGSSKVLQTTLTIGEFQSRIDFGISAKAIAFELYNLAQNSPLKLHGYTIEQRLLRKV